MRRSARVAGLALLITTLTTATALGEFQGSDPFETTGPGSLVHGSLLDKYPSGRFALDSYIDVGISHPTGWGASVLQLLTAIAWGLTQMATRGIIQLIGWAFPGELLVGQHGALEPVGRAVQSVHDAIGDPWLIAGLLAAGIWAIWKSFVQRRYSEALGGLGMSVILVCAAMFFVFQPVQTITWINGQFDGATLAFLSAGSTASTSNPEDARRNVVDNLVKAQIIQPWTVLQFGGTEVCTDRTRHNSNESPVTGEKVPLPTGPGPDAICRDAVARYAPRYLAQAPLSDARQAEYEALRDGSVNSPDAKDHMEPGQFAGYSVDARDMPSVDSQQEGGSVGRFVYACFIGFASLGFLVLMGTLVFIVVLAQIFALVLLAFTPVALVAATIPGRGHDFARGLMLKLLTALVVKCVFALIIGIVVAVSSALNEALGGLGFLFAFGLQAVFFWGLFFGRHWLIAKASPMSPRAMTRVERHQSTVSSIAVQAVTRPVSAMTGLKLHRLPRPSTEKGASGSDGADGVDGKSNGNAQAKTTAAHTGNGRLSKPEARRPQEEAPPLVFIPTPTSAPTSATAPKSPSAPRTAPAAPKPAPVTAEEISARSVKPTAITVGDTPTPPVQRPATRPHVIPKVSAPPAPRPTEPPNPPVKPARLDEPRPVTPKVKEPPSRRPS